MDRIAIYNRIEELKELIQGEGCEETCEEYRAEMETLNDQFITTPATEITIELIQVAFGRHPTFKLKRRSWASGFKDDKPCVGCLLTLLFVDAGCPGYRGATMQIERWAEKVFGYQQVIGVIDGFDANNNNPSDLHDREYLRAHHIGAMVREQIEKEGASCLLPITAKGE